MPRRSRAARKQDGRRPTRSDNGRFVLVILAAGAVLFGCLGVGAAGVYYFGFSERISGPSPEDELIGDWEMDPEPFEKAAAKTPLGVGMYFDIKMTFNKDLTFKMDMLIQNDGRWKVVGRDGNRLRVRMTSKVFGFDQDNPPTATITIIDHDHMDFDANEQSMQLQGRFRRVGSGPPVRHIGDPAPAAGPKSSPPAAAAPADGWMSHTLEDTVTVELPARPIRTRSGVTARSGDMLRFTEYTVTWAGPEIRIRVYHQPRVQDRNLGGRSIAEYVGAASLAERGPLPGSDRMFTQTNKLAAVFTRRAGKDAAVHLSIGDASSVCLVSVPGKTEQDPTVKRVFTSVRFGK